MPNRSRPALDPARLDRAFDLVARQVADGRTSYAALAVARSDGLVRSAAFGRDGRLDPIPRSAIASITKPITATAVMQLVEAGVLVLTEPLVTYLPEFAPGPPADADGPSVVTTRHVLTHTAGLSDAPDDFLLGARPTRESLMARVSSAPLRFQPGTAYAYTSDSFYLLADLVERLSAVPFADYLRRRIFEPLGMSATTFDPAEPGPPPVPLEGRLGPPGVPMDEVVEVFIDLALPGGGLWSTPDDVARFGRAILLGGTADGVRILGRPFVELMTRDHTDGIGEHGTGKPQNYGLGWGRSGLDPALPASGTAFGHGGASGSGLLIDPAYDLVIVYLRNEWGAPAAPSQEAVQAVYGALDG